MGASIRIINQYIPTEIGYDWVVNFSSKEEALGWIKDKGASVRCQHKDCGSHDTKIYKAKRGFFTSWFDKTEDLPPEFLCERHGKYRKPYGQKDKKR